MKKDMNITPAALAAATAGDFANAIVAATPGGIEAQEAQGQRDLVKSERLPKDMGGFSREQFENLGFVFGDEADDIFVNCKLPDGWSYRPTEHSMHSDIIDDQRRRRVGVFYKAAFYDRRADCYIVQRFHAGTDFCATDEDYDGTQPLPVAVFDCGKSMKIIGKAAGYDEKHQLQKEAEKWLDKNYPNWRDPLAHWDED